jgi:pyruvate dehydrogenase E2 component (dihydrolipoamide acetyltransferase)
VGEIKMPQLGESVVEGTITKWLKKEGDEVSEDDLLVEVSTDKVDSEVPSSESGTLQKILVEEGETVKVGTPIAVVGEGAAAGDGRAEPSEPAESQEAEAKAAGDKAQAQAEDEDRQEKDAAAIDRSQEEAAAAAEGETKAEEDRVEEKAEAAPPKPKDDTSKRGIISPLVRRLADENDVNLDEVEGTGTGGRIRKADVMKYVETRKSRPAARPAASAEPAPEQAKPATKEAAKAEPSVREISEREELVPWTNIRRRTAEHMVASSRETARAWNAVEVDWSRIVQLREQAKGRFKEREGFSLTYMPFLARVVCDTLLDMPEVNATYDEENQANRVKHYVNLGIAVALEGGGLIVPVVKGADEKNLVGLARDIYDLANRARTKKLSPDDLVGGTFTITNPGPFGSVISVPIIPRGQAAILGFEAIKKRVMVTDDDAIAIRSMNFLSLSWDHRIIDGAEAARFLQRLAEKVETTDFTSELSHYL